MKSYCPFCRMKTYYSSDCGGVNRDAWYTFCIQCHARGPVQDTIEGAQRGWVKAGAAIEELQEAWSKVIEWDTVIMDKVDKAIDKL